MSKKRPGHPRQVAGEFVPRSDLWAVEHVAGRRGPLGSVEESSQVRSMPVTAWVRGYPVPVGPRFMVARHGEESPEVPRKSKKGKMLVPAVQMSLQTESTAESTDVLEIVKGSASTPGGSLVGAVVKVPEKQITEQLLLAKLSSNVVLGLVS